MSDAASTLRDSRHRARYLLLLVGQTTQRALLFGGDLRFLSEMIDDDGLMVDNLTRLGTLCPTPPELALHSMLPVPEPQALAVRCFSLG